MKISNFWILIIASLVLVAALVILVGTIPASEKPTEVTFESLNDKNSVERKLGELVNGVEHPDSQFYILLGERDMRAGGYAILELHAPGQSYRSVIENADLPLEKGLFSSYRIW